MDKTNMKGDFLDYNKEELDKIIGEAGFSMDIKNSLEDGCTKDEMIEDYNVLLHVIRALLTGGYLDKDKFVILSDLIRGGRKFQL